jgi:hypothetical protein
MRCALRTGALAVLRLMGESAASFVPFIGFALDVAMVADIARTIVEFRQLKIAADAAIEFVKKGPYSFEELQVAPNGEYEQFSSYDEFYKDTSFAELLEKRFGPAGPGKQYHHIVTQGGANAANIPAEELQNTDNIVELPTLLHEAVSGEYSKNKPGTNMTVYQWLQTQPHDVQRDKGLEILRNLRILKSNW